MIKVWAAEEGKWNDAGGRMQVCDSTMTLQLRRTFCTAHRQFESPLCVGYTLYSVNQLPARLAVEELVQ